MKLPRKTKKLFREQRFGFHTMKVMLCPLPGAPRRTRRRAERYLAFIWRECRRAALETPPDLKWHDTPIPLRDRLARLEPPR